MIVLDRITKRFDSIVALDDLSLTVREGEIFGLLGPNGAGKSTLINIALGLVRADAGTVTIAGGPVRGSRGARMLTGMAPQSVAVYEELTADENLRFFGRTYGLSGDILRDRVDRALARTGLTDRRHDSVGGYSGGMKRRLNIAAALIHEPAIIFLDEPTVGVDPQSRNAVFESIEELRREGRTVVYTTHYMEEAQRLCDRVAIIDHGRLLALDTVGGLLARYGGPAVLVADAGGAETRIETTDPVGELVRLRQSVDLRDFRIEKPDLEGVFLKLTGRLLRD